MSFQQNTIEEYLDLLGSKKPAPGGGSALALVLETAASLGMMVCNLTIDKKGYEHLNEKIKSTLVELESVKNVAKELMDLDASSFTELMSAFKTKDKTLIETAAYKSAMVPYRLFLETKKLQNIVEELSIIGNKNVVSDAMIAVDLCKSIYPGCKLNFDANIPFVNDTKKEYFVF
ncbi:MAG: cyclodeaminase/cyclohydrolase family protein [Bacillales bacterium]|nr:cyclodeaminase/cyclohydrolase family protein [Bacillales bacterium]